VSGYDNDDDDKLLETVSINYRCIATWTCASRQWIYHEAVMHQRIY